jgi:hypothetical protein
MEVPLKEEVKNEDSREDLMSDRRSRICGMRCTLYTCQRSLTLTVVGRYVPLKLKY